MYIKRYFNFGLMYFISWRMVLRSLFTGFLALGLYQYFGFKTVAIPWLPVSEPRTRLHQSGVIATPNIPEILALNIEAAIFPSAIETITTEDDTVDGRLARKKVPIHNKFASVCTNNGFTANINRGKRTNVAD